MDSPHSPSPDVLFRNVPDLTSITERIGTHPFAKGGYSDIWRGVERRGGIERDVVIKIIRLTTQDEVNIDRIKKQVSREVIAWHSLNHRNILPFDGLCWLSGYDQHCLPSLVFPYCEAGTCVDYLKGHPDADRTSIVHQVASALDYLHTLDPPVVHGDIKACNILMQEGGTPMLADFGLSRVMMEGPTGLTTSSIRGSCRWMAPELFGDGETDAFIPVSQKSDVWAFGCLCLEVLWDTLPWASIRTDPLVIRAVTSKQHPPLPTAVASTALGHIVRHCWTYKAEDRPRMNQLVSALVSNDPEPLHNSTCKLQSDAGKMPRIKFTIKRVMAEQAFSDSTNVLSSLGSDPGEPLPASPLLVRRPGTPSAASSSSMLAIAESFPVLPGERHGLTYQPSMATMNTASSETVGTYVTAPSLSSIMLNSYSTSSLGPTARADHRNKSTYASIGSQGLMQSRQVLQPPPTMTGLTPSMDVADVGRTWSRGSQVELGGWSVAKQNSLYLRRSLGTHGLYSIGGNPMISSSLVLRLRSGRERGNPTQVRL